MLFPPRNRFLALFFALAILAVAPSAAAVSIDVDAGTLNDLLTALTVQEVQVELMPGNTMAVQFDDMRVLGFDPASGPGKQDQIRTALTLIVPDLGVRVDVEPRISLHVLEQDGQSVIEVRYEKVSLPVPLMGEINLAKMLDPIRFPTDSVFYLKGAEGTGSEIKSRLAKIAMGSRSIRLTFDIEVLGKP